MIHIELNEEIKHLPVIGKIRMVKVKIRAWTHPQDELGRMRIWHMAELHDSRH